MMRLSKLGVILLEFIAIQQNHGHLSNVADVSRMLKTSVRYRDSPYLNVYMTVRRALSKLEKEGLIVRNPSYRGHYYTISEKGTEWLGNNKTRVKQSMEWLEERIKYGDKR